MSGAAARAGTRDLVKWAFFIAVAVGTVMAVYADERFLFDMRDPEWAHIAPARWWLLLHAVAGITAFVAGPFQFSDRLRRTRLQLHRWLGRIYVGAIFIAAPVALLVASRIEQPLVLAEQPAQAGGWLLCTALALICVLRGKLESHKRWMMKSYAFTLNFMISRVPDFFHVQWTDASLSATLWYLVVVALIGPDIVLTVRELARKRPLRS